jgi:hypothetical protein
MAVALLVASELVFNPLIVASAASAGLAALLLWDFFTDGVFNVASLKYDSL